MLFGLFKKHCPVCGMDVKKETAIKKFGEYFCSEQHAEDHRQKLAKEESKSTKHSGGCCS
ncbi:MAG: hypothetical protein AAB540_03830 [Patescibacteria group bacterium]